MAMDVNGRRHPLRRDCRKCGHRYGIITTKSGQDVVNCEVCGTYDHCAPKVDTGREPRTLRSRPDISPSRRWRILDIHGHACVACHRTGVELQLAHLISRDDADRHGFLDEIIDSDLNLAPMCAECNSGQRPMGSVGIRLLYRCLVIAHTKATT